MALDSALMSNVSIRKKMYFLIFGVVLALVAIGNAAVYGVKSLSDILRTQDTIRQVESKMLMLRRFEKDFLARKDLTYADRFALQMNEVIQSLDHLRDESSLSPETVAHLVELIAIFDRYNTQFENLVAIQQRIGLDHKTGLHGELRAAVQNAEALVNEASNDGLRADILMLRRNEKDFLQRLDISYRDKFDDNLNIFSARLASSSLSSADKSNITGLMNRYSQSFHQVISAYEELGLDSNSGVLGNMREEVHATEVLLEEVTLEMVEDSAQQQSKVEWTIRVVVVSLSIVLGILMLLLVRNITGSLDNVVKRMMDIAQGNGDLRVRLPEKGRDEMSRFGVAFNEFVSRIQDVVKEVSGTSQDLAAAAQQSLVSIDQAAGMAKQQQSETEQVATAIGQMTASVAEVAHSAVTASEVTQAANSESIRGKSMVDANVTAIQQLSADVDQAAEVINQLTERTESIGSILDVIRSISDQTNLLALNAAIEAARAGEQGRGFAVVADEVRTLAKRTQDSTSEIQSMIEDLRSGVQSATQVMSKGRQSAELVVVQATDSGQALATITEEIGRVSDFNSQIAAASAEQSSVTEGISSRVSNINEIAHQSSSKADALRESSSSLVEQSKHLYELTRQFKT